MKEILSIAMISLTSFAMSQVKFYTDNGTKEATELNCSTKDLKVKIVLSDEILNHDFITVAYEDDPNYKTNSREFYWEKDYKRDYLNGKKSIELWLKKPNSEHGDLCMNGGCNKLFTACESEFRDYSSAPIIFRVYGRDFEKKEWIDNAWVKKYKYVFITEGKVNVTYGEVSSTVASGNNLFEVQKYSSEKGNAEIDADSRYDLISAQINHSDGDKVIFDCRKVEEDYTFSITQPDYDYRKKISNGSTVEDLKYAVERELFINTHKLGKRKIPMSKSGISNEGIGKSMYAALLASEKSKSAANNEGKKGKGLLGKMASAYKGGGGGSGGTLSSTQEAELFAKNRHQYFIWKTETIGNKECQVLDIPVYKESQLKQGNKGLEVKDEERGKTTQLKVFVLENNGAAFIGTIYKEGISELTSSETEFWNFILKSLKFN